MSVLVPLYAKHEKPAGLSKFDLDLLDGIRAERSLAGILTSKRGTTIEVKRDRLARRTGNVFVEVEHRGEPSGLSTSEARWWAIEVDRDVWVLLPARRLRRLVELARSEGRTARGGDGGASFGALVPLSWLVQPVELVR